MIKRLFFAMGLLTHMQGFCFVTNPTRTDGFGAQYQTILYAMIYAELHNEEFRYTPFQSMEHNYENDPEFLAKKEELIQLIDHLPLNTDPAMQTIPLTAFIAFFEANLEAALQTKALQKAKDLSFKNKSKADYFDPNYLHVAIHIRKANQHDCREVGNFNRLHRSVMNNLNAIPLNKPLRIHIFSQGDLELFKKEFPLENVQFHLNESIEDTFTAMTLADILVTSSAGSFSYVAALISEGKVIYHPFWHPPMPEWLVFENKVYRVGARKMQSKLTAFLEEHVKKSTLVSR